MLPGGLRRLISQLSPLRPLATMSDPPPVYLVMGSSRGVGVQLVKQILDRGCSVVATCRNPDTATQLADVVAAKKVGDNFAKVLPLDVSNETSIVTFMQLLGEHEAEMGRKAAIDVLVHNAGISAPTHPQDPAATALASSMKDCFETNALGPLLLTQQCLPRLRAGSLKKVLFMSSQMGSMEKTNSGTCKANSCISYRSSKAALNMVARCLAAEHGIGTDDNLAMTLCHPGWVATEMGSAGDRSPPVKPEDSVIGILAVIDNMGENSKANFVSWEGNEINW